MWKIRRTVAVWYLFAHMRAHVIITEQRHLNLKWDWTPFVQSIVYTAIHLILWTRTAHPIVVWLWPKQPCRLSITLTPPAAVGKNRLQWQERIKSTYACIYGVCCTSCGLCPKFQLFQKLVCVYSAQRLEVSNYEYHNSKSETSRERERARAAIIIIIIISWDKYNNGHQHRHQPRE